MAPQKGLMSSKISNKKNDESNDQVEQHSGMTDNENQLIGDVYISSKHLYLVAETSLVL